MFRLMMQSRKYSSQMLAVQVCTNKDCFVKIWKERIYVQSIERSSRVWDAKLKIKEGCRNGKQFDFLVKFMVISLSTINPLCWNESKYLLMRTKSIGNYFITGPMYVYDSNWDESDWVTDGG